MITKKPLVSCVCISKRQNRLANAIHHFNSQTYPNKELLVVVNEDDEKCIAYLKSLSMKGVRYFVAGKSNETTLGQLRNISIEQSRGDYFCQWDDDDWYHCQRIEVQTDEMIKNKKRGSVLAYWLMYNSVNQRAYLSFPHIWAGTILCDRAIYSETIRYPEQDRGEDSVFLQQLYAKNCLYPIVMPTLYVYVFHGENTYPYNHFKFFFDQSQQLSSKTSRLVTSILNNEYSPEEGSRLLQSAGVLREFDYFKAWKEA